MQQDDDQERDRDQSAVEVAEPVETAAPGADGPGWVIGGLAVVGILALLAVGGLVALALALQWHDPALPQALERTAARARSLPGVAAVTTEKGIGDLGVDPVDGYLDVRLRAGCTPDDVARRADDLRALIRRELAVHLHPTVGCDGHGFTVSSDARTTARRLAVYRTLAADTGLREAVLAAPQIGDDPTPDVDDSALRLRLATDGPVGATARTWSRRLATVLPSVGVLVTNGDADAPQSRSATVPRIRTVELAQGDESLLRVAVELDGLDRAAGWYVGAEPCQVAVEGSWSSALADRVAAGPAGCTLQWRTPAAR